MSANYAEGRYVCEVVDQGLSTAQSSGNVMIVLKFRVCRGTQPEQVFEQGQQYLRTMWLAVTEKTMEYLVPKLQALGYDRDGISFLDLANPRHHDLRGKEFDGYCKHEIDERTGESKEKWDVSTRQGGSKPLELKAPESKAIRNMDMLFARARKNLGQATPAKAGPQPVPSTNQEVTNDDVPF